MKRVVAVILVVVLAGILFAALALIYNLPLDTSDPSPTQPFAFSHRLHAGDYQIDCLYCHRGADIVPVAGIPPMSICQGCHLHIATDRPEIVKLQEQIEREETIAWIKVYDLPEHVYFPHMMHLRAQLACTLCHGQVVNMDQIVREVEMEMGWCLDCHRQHRASIDCWTCHI